MREDGEQTGGVSCSSDGASSERGASSNFTTPGASSPPPQACCVLGGPDVVSADDFPGSCTGMAGGAGTGGMRGDRNVVVLGVLNSFSSTRWVMSAPIPIAAAGGGRGGSGGVGARGTETVLGRRSTSSSSLEIACRMKVDSPPGESSCRGCEDGEFSGEGLFLDSESSSSSRKSARRLRSTFSSPIDPPPRGGGVFDGDRSMTSARVDRWEVNAGSGYGSGKSRGVVGRLVIVRGASCRLGSSPGEDANGGAFGSSPGEEPAGPNCGPVYLGVPECGLNTLPP